MMARLGGWWAIFCAVPMLTGCGGAVPSNAAVERTGVELFTAIKNKEYDRALDLYAEDFFATHAREQWKEFLQKLQRQLGDMQSFQLTQQQSDTRYSGKFYIYEYTTVYETEKAWQTVTFFVPVDGQEVKVFGHQVKAKGMNPSLGIR